MWRQEPVSPTGAAQRAGAGAVIAGGQRMRTTGVIVADPNGGGGIYISPTSPFWDELEELQREQGEAKERRARYGCLTDQLCLDL